jgi:hypothetical protein
VANDPGALLAALVGAGRTVLHLGCGDGTLARGLVAQGCTVTGVAAVAPEDGAHLEAVLVADLATTSLTSSFKPGSFEVVVADASTPAAVLRDASSLLTADGRLLVAARNSAHGSRRLALLLGHVAEPAPDLVTADGLCDLLEEAGLAVHELHSTVRDPLVPPAPASGVGLSESDAALLPSDVVEWVRFQPGALDDTYVAVARPADPGDPFESRPEVTPAVPAHTVRAEDQHTAWVRRDREERHRMLTVRDHILGLEAGLVSADLRVSRSRARARAASQRARRARDELDALVAELEELSRSRRRRRGDVADLLARLRRRADRDDDL